MNCWPRLPGGHSHLLSPQFQQARRPVSLSPSPSAVSFPPAVATSARDSSLLFPHSINGRRGPGAFLTQRLSPCAASPARADPATLPGLHSTPAQQAMDADSNCCVRTCLSLSRQALFSCYLRNMPPTPTIKCNSYQRVLLFPITRLGTGCSQEKVF